MGQYLQMGICYRMEIDKKSMDRLDLTYEKLVNELNKQIDMSLFNCREAQDELTFEIKESIILLEQLQGFMQLQYSMYPQEQPYIDCFKSAVEAIGELSSFQEMVQVAEEGNFPCLQSNVITDEIKIGWKWIKVEFSMFVLFVEGKIFMEGYKSLLEYIENIVRESSEKWAIAGAYKCFID